MERLLWSRHEKYSRSYFVSGRRTIERGWSNDTIDTRYIADATAMSIEIRKIAVVRYLVERPILIDIKLTDTIKNRTRNSKRTYAYWNKRKTTKVVAYKDHRRKEGYVWFFSILQSNENLSIRKLVSPLVRQLLSYYLSEKSNYKHFFVKFNTNTLR